MARIPAQLSQRGWIFWVNGFIGFVALIVLLEFLQTNVIFGSYRWFELPRQETQVQSVFCRPRKNIVFLKTHKCASSSVQNILLRRAHQKNLTVALPISSKNHYLSWKKPFTKDMIRGAPWEDLGYNIICHHMIFNSTAVEQVMPPDSLYITIIRDPVALFESMYEYDQLQEFYKMNIEEYAKATKNTSALQKLLLRANAMGRNQMLYDLGVRPSQLKNRENIKKIIRTFDRRFDFVMVAESFDESIVLLKHILCWDWDDMVSLTVNARMNSYKKNLTNETVSLLREWLFADQMLYDYFLKRFEETVAEFGKKRLKREVEYLQERRKAYFEECVEGTVQSINLTSYKIWSQKVVGFKLKPSAINNATCEDLVKPEKFFTNEMRQHQIIRSLSKANSVSFQHSQSAYRLLDFSKLKQQELEIVKKTLSAKYKARKHLLSKRQR